MRIFSIHTYIYKSQLEYSLSISVGVRLTCKHQQRNISKSSAPTPLVRFAKCWHYNAFHRPRYFLKILSIQANQILPLEAKTGILPHRASSTCDKKLSKRTSINHNLSFPFQSAWVNGLHVNTNNAISQNHQHPCIR